MGNVLAKNTPANTRYTEFENNQVLTADQLNDLFRYLDIQTRLTRTKGIGVGIVCGLEIGVTEENTIVVSKGSAITTDGDLLFISNDLNFDQFLPFEDTNAKYDYFFLDNGSQIPLFELVNSKITRTQGKGVGEFEQSTNTGLKDYVGILYQEDYNNDTDLCTGVDCDNRGIECVRDIKVLLAHKDQVGELLKSIPKLNQKYFALDEIDVPRVMIKNTISKFEELRGAFGVALGIKDTLKARLQKAFEVCKPLVEDELGSDNPAREWGELLDQHFSIQNGIYAQYLYDFVRDLSYGYIEMKETLFNDNAICCPPIELFPKHVMMGLVKTAKVKRPELTPVIPMPVPVTPIPRIRVFDFASTIKFDLGALIRRFHPVHIDIEYRHQFYESPVLNNKEENQERTKFCFKRFDAMIRNFKVPTSEDLQNPNSIRITPSQFEEQRLGERTIPFYYKYDRARPINAYWSFEANVRKRENEHFYYFASQYTNGAVQNDPLKFNLLPYTFFRVEGHIGYKYQEVQRVLNRIIDENNLPINIVTVQLEREIRTIPDLQWWFPQIHVYEQFVRNTFLDHINQADLVHRDLKEQTNDDVDKVKINLAIDKFATVRSKVVEHKTLAEGGFNLLGFKKDVTDAIDSAAEVKVQTQKFAFSNTAVPHDFVINTDVLHKTDMLVNLRDDLILRKKQGLMLGNFMKKNPGLEHAGGVLRGGTFILVYTSNDDRVVADFMLPYASVDQDIVPDPPVVRPIPRPEIQKIPPRVFEKVPSYKKFIDEKVFDVSDKIKFFDERVKEADTRIGRKLIDLDDSKKILDEKMSDVNTRVAGKLAEFDVTKKGFDEKVKDVEGRLNQRIGDIEVTRKLFDDNVKLFDTKIKSVDAIYTGKLSEFENKLDYQGKIFNNIANVIPNRTGVATPGKTGVVVGGVNILEHADTITRLTRELDTLPPGATNERIVRENQLAEATKKITDAVNTPGAIVEKEDEATVKSILFDAQIATEKITANPNLRTNVAGTLRNTSGTIGRIIRGGPR
jgi:hypothetical protein